MEPSNVDLVALKPQPLPPKAMIDFIALNAQPLPTNWDPRLRCSLSMAS